MEADWLIGQRELPCATSSSPCSKSEDETAPSPPSPATCIEDVRMTNPPQSSTSNLSNLNSADGAATGGGRSVTSNLDVLDSGTL